MTQTSTNPKDRIGKTKPPLHLIPSGAMIQEAQVMKLGAAKYGPYNWRDESVSATVYVSAMQRHMLAWLDGEDLDPESGASHLAHARACAGILLDAESVGNLVDDRPTKGAASELLARFTEPTELATATTPKRTRGTVEPPSIRRLRKALEGNDCRPEVIKIILAGTTVGQYGSNICYVAGPMRDHYKFNFVAFDRGRDLMVSNGWTVISPADIDRADGQGASELPAPVYIYRDLHALQALRSEDAEADCIFLLKGWRKSTGASAEYAVAKWLGLTIYEEGADGGVTPFHI